jgi:hypothetical protein
LEVAPVVIEGVAVAKPLPGFVGTRAFGLGAELEDGQHLESRFADSQTAQQLEKALLALERAVVLVYLGDGDDGIETRRNQIRDSLQDLPEGTVATDGVVGLGAVAVERDAEVERVVGLLGEVADSLAALEIQEQAVGQHRHRSDPQGMVENRLHLRVQEGLATGEVELLDAEALGLLEIAQNRLQGEELVGPVGGRAGDETVSAGQIAERTRHLEPESIERAQADPGSGGLDGCHRQQPSGPAQEDGV